MKKEGTIERILKAMEATDNGSTWEAASTANGIGHNYLYFPKEFRMKVAIQFMLNYFNLKYNYPEALNYLLKRLSIIKTERTLIFDIQEPMKNPSNINNYKSQELVDELRRRGWDVQCTKTIKKEL